MPDISKCGGTGCDYKYKCWRFTSKPSEHMQTYFVAPPSFNGQCDFFWNDDEYSDERKIPVSERTKPEV